MPEETQETNKEEESEEDTPDPVYICGIVVGIRVDGNGVEFNSIMENPLYARPAGISDVNMMSNHLADHTRALMTAAQTVELIKKTGASMMINKKILKGGLRH